MLFGCAIFDYAMELLDQDSRISFLGFEFKKRRKRNIESSRYCAYYFQRGPFFTSLNFSQIACSYSSLLSGKFPRHAGGFSNRAHFSSEENLVIHSNYRRINLQMKLPDRNRPRAYIYVAYIGY